MTETNRIEYKRELASEFDIGRGIYNIYEHVLMMVSILQTALSLHYKCS